MATVVFTRNLSRHVDVKNCEAAGKTVREILEAAFAQQPAVRTYVLDDQGGLRKHMGVFVDGEQMADRIHLSDLVKPDSRIDVIQSLSGG